MSSTRVTRRGRRCVGVGLVAATALLGCFDQGPVAGPGTRTVTLVSPNGPEGAVVLVLLGEGIGETTSTGGAQLFRRDGMEGVRLALVDTAGGTLAFRLELADTTSLPAVVVEQVAGPDDALRPALQGYRVDFAP